VREKNGGENREGWTGEVSWEGRVRRKRSKEGNGGGIRKGRG